VIVMALFTVALAAGLFVSRWHTRLLIRSMNDGPSVAEMVLRLRLREMRDARRK
jgi:hypothetical protein